MPNHWHLVVNPVHDGELSNFTGWLTLTHTKRWHAHRHSKGQGHVYQGLTGAMHRLTHRLTLESLGDVTTSLNWYKRCIANAAFPGLAGWAAFSAARILHKEKGFEASKHLCFEGLKMLPASPELIWLWGLNEYSMGRFFEAASISVFAISLVDGPSKIDFRSSSICRDLPAWFELPFDLHSWALLKLGDEVGSRRYRELADEKRMIRVALLQQVGNIQ